MQLAPRRLLTGLLTLFLLSTGCGGEDAGSGQGKSAGDVETYCKLTRQLDREGEKFFKKLEQKSNATPKDFKKAERDFVEAHKADLANLKAAAPKEVSDDAKTVIASLRGRAGLGPKVEQSRASTAEKRIQKFERRNCK